MRYTKDVKEQTIKSVGAMLASGTCTSRFFKSVSSEIKLKTVLKLYQELVAMQ